MSFTAGKHRKKQKKAITQKDMTASECFLKKKLFYDMK